MHALLVENLRDLSCVGIHGGGDWSIFAEP